MEVEMAMLGAFVVKDVISVEEVLDSANLHTTTTNLRFSLLRHLCPPMSLAKFATNRDTLLGYAMDDTIMLTLSSPPLIIFLS